MKTLFLRLLAGLIVGLQWGYAGWAGEASVGAEKEKAGDKIEWVGWSDAAFARAKAEKKLVLLDVVAVWCHWCHVMDEITYRDSAVVKLVREHYIAVRVDQDARPDISNRYEDYGWPATVVFDAAAKELAKRQGYLPPRPMAGMLQAFVDDPTPGPSVQPQPVLAPAPEGGLTESQRAAMRKIFIEAYDSKLGGWGDVHKYLNWDALEYCLTEGAAGDARLKAMARQTLTAGLRLIDPVWGGVYQYSTDGDWEHPHYEKIMPFQAENLRVFAAAATLRGEPQWLDSARKIRGYLRDFLTSPEGAFYASQDADLVDGEHAGEYFALDDAGRRARGIPRVDRHLYARENGLAITGLAALYAADGDEQVLADARRAVEWVLANRALDAGGFRHDERDVAGPYLADTLAMGRAFLALYAVTGERTWLTRAEAAARFIDTRFRGPIGFSTAVAAVGSSFAPKPQVDENIELTRFANLLGHYAGQDFARKMAEHAMRFLASPVVVAQQGYGTSGILLADRELRSEPAHFTVVGRKNDPAARALFEAILRGAPPYSRIEWLDPAEGPLAHDDVPFPALPQAAAFVCANGSCSLPLMTVEKVAARLRKGRSEETSKTQHPTSNVQ
ncbi:MAG TPA: DUF255 domain-containing protein [Chthoniobacter sp.]|jgi:hypothetical protein